MYERFTERALQVVVLAEREARMLEHNYIGTEHILLGLLQVQESLAARALESFGITIERVRAQVVQIVGSGTEVTAGQIPFTPRAKKVLELAVPEALGLGNNHIGPEHILLGLARENEGVAARILLDFDADSQKIRNEVIRVLQVPNTAVGRPASTPEEPLLEPARATTSQPPDVSDWVLRGRPLFGWRSRPVALAALGAASMSRRAFDRRAPDDLDPLALQLLVAVALSQPAGDQGIVQNDRDPGALRAVLSCDGGELEDATVALLAAGLIGTQETHDPFDPELDEQWLMITDRGSAFVEAWLGRIAPLFGAWPPSSPEVDDAH